MVALTAALPAVGHAQGGSAVSGTVRTPDGRPLSGVVVAIPSLGLSEATTATGRYVLPRVPAGRYVLQFRRLGYSPREMNVDVTADTPFTADAILEPQPVELGSIVVEGVSRAPDRVIDAPAAVAVVRPAAVEAALVSSQAPLALVPVGGLDVLQGSVTDFNVNTRGFTTMLTRKMLVLQDGRDLATAVGGSETWGALSEPPGDLERIEVIRGPGSALYGPNAYDGVINITTPVVRDALGTRLTLGGGELGTARADLREAGQWLDDKFGYRVNLGYTRSGDWTRSRTAKDGSDWRGEYAPATATPPSVKPDSLPLFGQVKDPVTGQAVGTPDPVASVYGAARLDYYAADHSILTLEGGTAQLENSVFLSGTGRNQSPRILRPWARLAWAAGGSAVSAWYSGASFTAVGLGNGATLYNDESVFHVEGSTSRSFRGDAGRLVVGASVQDNKVDSRGTALGPANDDRNHQYYGAFAQLEYEAGVVRAIGAVRWDDSDLFTRQLSPKGALVVSLAKNHALRVTVNRAFLTPSLVNLLGGRPTGGVEDLSAIEANLRADPTVGPALAAVAPGKLFENSAAVPESAFGNPRLLPQTVTSYELGYKGQFGPRVFMTLDAYAAHMQNFATGLLPGVNPAYPPWSAPPEVPAADRPVVDSAVRSAFNAANPTFANGLTRLGNDTTAIVESYGNVGDVDEWGLELSTSVALTRALTLSASYTWYNFAVRQNLVRNVLAPNTPQDKGTVALTYAGRQGIALAADARFISRYQWRTGVWDGEVPASQTVNVHAAYRINLHLRVFAETTNLLNQERFQVYGGAVIGRRVLAGVTSTF